MSNGAPYHAPGKADERASSRSAHGISLVHVLWGLTGMLLGVVVGAAGMGDNLLRYLSPEPSRHPAYTEISGKLEELRRDLSSREKELGAERQERKEAVAALKEKLEASEWRSLAAMLKVDVTERMLAHQRAPSTESRRLLAEAACGLRNQSGVARAVVLGAPLEVSSETLRRGSSAELEQILLQRGLGAELLARARRDPNQIAIPAVTPFNVFEVQRAAQARRMAMRDAQDAIGTIQRELQSFKVPRALRFSDGSEQAIPGDVALLMLQRRDCQPD